MTLVFRKTFHINGGLLAEGIDAVQIFVGKSLIDDGHMLFFGELLRVEETAGTQGNIHRVEIIGADDADVGDGKIGESEWRLAKNVNGSSSAQTGERRKTFHGGGTDAGDGAEF